MKVSPLLNNIDSNSFLEDYLTACGVKDVDKYLNATLDDCDSYWDYPNMEKGVERLAKAINNNEKIGVVVDEDNDGYTSSSVIYQFIKKINPNQPIAPIFHPHKTHGIVVNEEENVVQTAIDRELNLLICPDSASNDADKCATLKENGIDVLILDHHEITTPPNEKDAILINHHLDKEHLNIGLSGCGVTFKFVQACSEVWDIDIGNDYYDLVASSIVSDDCDMRYPENYALVKYGFTHMTNPMLVKMYEEFNSRGCCPEGVSWGMSPRVNAITRCGSMEDKALLFGAFVGERDVEEAIEMAKSVHKHQGDETKILVSGLKKNIDYDHKVLVGFSDDEHRNYSGLVANKFVGDNGKPTLILRPLTKTYENEDGSIATKDYWSGSMRSPVPLADKINETEIAKCQGHLAACGIIMPQDKLDELIEWFDNSPLDMNPSKDVAAIISPNQINLRLCHICADNPLLWGGSSGAGILKPVFYTSFEVSPTDVTFYKKKFTTVKFQFKNGVSIVKFRAKKEDVALLEENPCKVEMTINLEPNEYNGRETPQAIVEEWEIVPIAKCDNEELDWEDIF